MFRAIDIGENLFNRLAHITNAFQQLLSTEYKSKSVKQIPREQIDYFKNIRKQFGQVKSLLIRQTTFIKCQNFYKRYEGLPLALRTLNNKDVQGDCVGFYISTNESNSKNIRQVLTDSPKKKFGCHVGFSGFHNFDIMIARGSKLGVICDYNPWNIMIMDEALRLLTISETTEEWIERFSDFAAELDNCGTFFSPNVNSDPEFSENNDKNLTWKNLIELELKIESSRKGSWLSTKENFEYIRRLAFQGHIVCIVEDILHTENFLEMEALLTKNSAPIDSLYLSNICKYMDNEENKKAFINTVKTLTQPDTLVINCPSTNTDKDPIQHICKEKTYLSEAHAPFFTIES